MWMSARLRVRHWPIAKTQFAGLPQDEQERAAAYLERDDLRDNRGYFVCSVGVRRCQQSCCRTRHLPMLGDNRSFAFRIAPNSLWRGHRTSHETQLAEAVLMHATDDSVVRRPPNGRTASANREELRFNALTDEITSAAACRRPVSIPKQGFESKRGRFQA